MIDEEGKDQMIDAFPSDDGMVVFYFVTFILFHSSFVFFHLLILSFIFLFLFQTVCFRCYE